MLLHDLIVALRRIARQRFYSAMSVLALAFGLVCFIATYLLVSYVRSYDRNFANVDRTYVIGQSVRAESQGVDMPFGVSSALNLGEHLRLDVPELAAVARRQMSRLPVTADGETSARAISYVEAPFFDIFDFVTLTGDVHAAAQPRSAVLTRRTAQQMFGDSAAVGHTITLHGAQQVDVAVAAVIDDVPIASHLARDSLFSNGFDLLVSWDVFELIGKGPFIDSWGNTPVITYALLPANGSFTVSEFSKPVVAANVVAWPFVFIAANAYLAVFTERIALGPLPFALALLATLALAWLAVGLRVLRAASLNPARALRHE